MKKAVILHGKDANPMANWFPWLKAKLETEGYEVWVPDLPENHSPNKELYGNFLFNSGWDFTDNLVVGHSAGAVEILNMLMDNRCPQLKTAVCVSAWDHGVPAGMDAAQFLGLFPKDGFDFEVIKHKVGRIEFLHGENDPYCPLEQAQYLSEQTGGSLTVVPGGDHLGENYPELPEIWSLINR